MHDSHVRNYQLVYQPEKFFSNGSALSFSALLNNDKPSMQFRNWKFRETIGIQAEASEFLNFIMPTNFNEVIISITSRVENVKCR